MLTCKYCGNFNLTPMGKNKIRCDTCGKIQAYNELVEKNFNSKTRGFEHVSVEQWEKATLDFPEIVIGVCKYDEIQLPKRATAHSAGYDVFSTLSFILKPGATLLIPTGFKAYMLEDEKVSIHPRSGLGFKYFVRLANTTGIVDSDYYNNEGNEGHFFIKLRNEGENILEIKKGDAVAQCIFEKFLLADGDTFNGAKRTGGFGSTG